MKQATAERHAAPLRDIVNGYPVTPLKGKRPVRKGWQERPIRSGLEWLEADPSGNHGIVLRREDRVLVVDVDVKGGESGTGAFREWVGSSGLDLRPYPHQRTPSGGHHFVGRIPEGYPADALPNGSAVPGVDALRDRKQFVRAPGSTPGGEYVEENPLPPLELLPEWPAAFLDKIREAAGSRSGDGMPPPQEELRAPSLKALSEVVAKIPNRGPSFDSRDDYIQVGYAIKAAAGPGQEGEALELFQRWASRWEDGENDPADVRDDFNGFDPPFRVGWPYLLELAGETVRLAQETFPADREAPDPPAEPPPRPTGMLGAIRTAAELAAEPRPDLNYVVEDTLAKGRASILAAPPKKGKSTLARALAAAVANGGIWCGLEVVKGRVLYVALEEHWHDVTDDLELFGGAVPNLDVFVGRAPEDLADSIMEAAEARGDYSLIIVDTIFRGVRAEDGNDYAATTDALDNIIGLAHTSGAHVLCIHHTRKGVSFSGGDPFEGILGSQGIWASFDAGMIYLPYKWGEDTDRVLSIDGRRHVEKGTRIIRQLPSGQLRFLGSYTEARSNTLHRYLRENGEQTYDEIGVGLEWGESTVRKYAGYLEDAGRIEKVGEGVKGDPYKWKALADPKEEFSADDEDISLSDLTGDTAPATSTEGA